MLAGCARYSSAATALHGFEVDETGTLLVPPVVAEPAFLNSEAFKLRWSTSAATRPSPCWAVPPSSPTCRCAAT